MDLLSKKPSAEQNVNTLSARQKEKFSTSKNSKSGNNSKYRHRRDTFSLSNIDSSSDYESEAISMATKYNRKLFIPNQRALRNEIEYE